MLAHYFVSVVVEFPCEPRALSHDLQTAAGRTGNKAVDRRDLGIS